MTFTIICAIANSQSMVVGLETQKSALGTTDLAKINLNSNLALQRFSEKNVYGII